MIYETSRMSSSVSTRKHKRQVYKNINNSKIIPALISKPEQGKKTIEMSRLLDNDLHNNTSILNIYITPNKKNQANQAHNTFITHMPYFKDKLKDHVDKIAILHGDKSDSKDPDGYVFRAEREHKRLIISLANKSRLTVILNIIVKWILCHNNNMVKIYIDEAGETRTLNTFIKEVWSQLEARIKDLNKVKIIFIDAHVRGITENKQFKQYFPQGMLHKLENEYDLSQYMYFSSLPYEIFEWNTVNCIIESYNKGEIELTNKDYVLLPLSIAKKDQYEEALSIVECFADCAVLVINGDGYHIFCKDDGQVTLPKKKCGKTQNCMSPTCPKCFPNMEQEINVVKHIKNTYSANKTFCMGGNLCIDRAMTYHDHSMPFTKSLITQTVLIKSPFISTKDYDNASIQTKESISQQVKRICHSFGTGDQAKYYGPQDIYNGVCKLEKDSVHIANQSGYITHNTIAQLNKGIVPELETEENIHEYELERYPFDYCCKVFENLPADDNVKIKTVLDRYRQKIGGTVVQKATIEIRMTGVEPDSKLADITLADFENDFSTLKYGLNEETKSRVRVCKDDEGNILWIIHFQNEKGTFTWNKKKYNIINIESDGNCLFNSFIVGEIPNTKSVKEMRIAVRKELVNNKEKYDKADIDPCEWDDECDKIKISDQWNDDIFDYCLYAISEIYDVNIIVFEFITMSCGGYKMLHRKPITIPKEKNKTNTICLRKLDNHYDLMQ